MGPARRGRQADPAGGTGCAQLRYDAPRARARAPEMSDLKPGVYSVTTTKRRRFLWCAWWTAAPARKPFQKPDAWSGGARTEEEARRQAEEAAGRTLEPIDPIWARAWVRIQAGKPPWVTRAPRRQRPDPEPPPREAPRRRPASVAPGTSPESILGVDPGASLDEIKRAFRRLALATHPDRGGDPAGFIRVKWALDEVLGRRRR